MQIRHFQNSDLESLYQIDQACFPSGISYSLGELSRFISRRGARTWIAAENEKIVGFVVVGTTPGHAGHIVTIDVVKEARCSGVGKALMNAVECWARKESLQLLSLETAEDNRTAHAFYSKLGYVKVDEIPGYYSNGTAAWVMVKQLEGPP